tara:strand:- start:249 stop:986 length:738 start_codon:yes stop_codon:yes gene_type:complete
MIKKSIFILFTVILLSHDIEEKAQWKQYYRSSYIVNESHNYGLGGYFRLKRTTRYTFRDFRAYLHFIKGDSYKKIRYKSSNKFREFDRFYNYSTISVDQNSKVGVNIRYHGNQGVGFFVKDFNSGHINAEAALAYDISDYLNDSRKTSYIKSGFYWDQNFNDYEIKLELEHYHQITDLIDDIDLSRLEFLFEVYFSLNDNLKVIMGYELESFKSSDNKLNSSVFLSIGYDNIFNINKVKRNIYGI